jgi:ubiquinone/menaquinone biosynthesis C-methylase UbiE
MAEIERGDHYVLGRHELSDEVRRLQILENCWDLYSQSQLLALGIGPGAHCLEAGVGAGSMARWMSEQVHPHGSVLGVDVNDEYLRLLDGSGVTVRKSDIRNLSVAPESFDFIHTRLLMMHIPERRELLATFAKWLRPGGWLLVVDLDFSFGYRVEGRLGELFTTATNGS